MAETSDRLIVGSEFDPSGLSRGLNVGVASLATFEKAVRQVAAQLPNLSAHDLATTLAPEFRKAAVEAAGFERKVREAVATFERMEAAQFRFRDPDTGRFISRATVELRTLAGQLQQIPGPALNATRALTQMNMALLAGSSGRIGDNGRSFQRGLDNIAASARKAGDGVSRLGHSNQQTAQHFVTLAASTIGADTAIARMAANVLFLSVGFTKVMIAAASIFAVAKIWELVTAKSREAKQAQEDAGKVLDDLAKSQIPAIQKAVTAFNDQKKAVDEARAALEKFNKEAGDPSKAIIGAGAEQAQALLPLIKEQTKLTAQLAVAEARLAAARQDVIASGKTLIADQARQIAVLTLGEAAVKRLEIANLGLDKATTAAAISQLKQIERLTRQKEAAEEAARALEALLRAQHDVRVANAGGGNLLPHPGHTTTDNVIRGGLLSGATAEGITDSRAAAVIKKNEEALQSFFKTAFRGFAGLTKWEADAVQAQLDMVQSLTDMGTTAFGLADVGRSLGIIGEEAVRALEDVGRLSDALAAVAANASFGNIVGAVAAGAGLLGSLFGETALAREHAALIKQNSERLAELRISMDASLQGLQGFAKSSGILKLDLSGTRTGGRPELEAALKAAGLSLIEFARLVEQQTGLRILDAEGQLVGKAFRQARDEIDHFRQEAERAAAEARQRAVDDRNAEAQRKASDAANQAAAALQALADAQMAAIPTVLQLRDQLLGVSGDPMAQFQIALQTLALQLPQLAGQFQIGNLNDPAAQAALKQQLLDFLSQIIAGTISPATMGTEEFAAFLAFLQQSTGILAGFDDAVEAATKSLMNVPTGVNMAALEFQAQAAGGRAGLPPAVRFPGGTRGGDGAALPSWFTTGQRAGTELGARPSASTTITGPITIIVQGADKSPEEIAQAVKKVLERQSHATFGTPDDWGST